MGDSATMEERVMSWRTKAARSRGTLFLAAGLLAGFGVEPWLLADGPAGKDARNRPTNRLAQEHSPYLRQHAHNPVDWYPWGPEAFARAKKEGKLVFLSIGYSSCHWCHVMERESFDDADVAKLLNEGFVCIKVDREERPDVDTVYMTALQVLGQRGGWPLSMFLTADGKPIVGGTYWPREDKDVEGQKLRGFKSVLKLVRRFQTDSPKELAAQADKVAEATNNALAGMVRGNALVELDRKLIDGAVSALSDEFDPDYGGFGSAERKFRGTKFPTPPYLVLLQTEAARTQDARLARMVDVTLDHMARGGIYDQLGGGFHRYSTERTWTVPHFEKMLYDNAQLAEVYALAFQRSKNPLYERVLRETLAFVARELTSPEGAFYSALDADSEGVEGRFYVWSAQEIEAAASDAETARLFNKVYGVDQQPNFEGKAFILTLPKSLAEWAAELKTAEAELDARLAPVRKALFDKRSKRPRPFLDTKVLTSWNGQMIAGYAAAGQALGEPKYIATAGRAAEFVLNRLRTPEGRLLRTYGSRPGASGEARLNGYLDDYAYLAHGLLVLHEATSDRKWLDAARSVTDTMIQFHSDPQGGGFYYTSNDHEKLFARAKDQYDGAQPSGNSAAAANLVQLWKRTGEERYRAAAEKTFRAFAGAMKANPAALTAMAAALVMYLEPNAQGAKKSDDKVKVSASADKPDAEGKQVVTVTLDVEKGWHVYANPPGNEDLVSVQTTVTVSAKTKPEDVKVEYPPGKEIKDSVLGKYKVYEDKVKIKATVKRAKSDTSPLEVSVKFQACDDMKCLLPATVKVGVP
jgi:uncharacterized protein YyaL (SSP411 family)